MITKRNQGNLYLILLEAHYYHNMKMNYMPDNIKDLEINVYYNSRRDKWVSINGEYFNKDEAFDFAMMLLRASSEILESLDRDITDNLKGK